MNDGGTGEHLRQWAGQPWPAGATWDGEGINFALFSQHATAVELCLFNDPGDAHESDRIRLAQRTNLVWHAYVRGLRPGGAYGYRVHGGYQPSQGLRFNPAKLLVDPYAKALSGRLRWDDAVFGYARGGGREDDDARDERDSAPFVPRSIIIDDSFAWGDDQPPRTPWEQSLIYECHVKGLTARHPDVPPHLRGTYLGLASEPIIEHLTRLGVTAVELLPVHQCVSEQFLVQRGLSNYWGYNTLAFFAPDARFASGSPGGPLTPDGVRGRQVAEFKSMVRALHHAGIEVILDVVFNHTAEGNHLGPTLSLRGVDNTSYYRLIREDPRYYRDFTGCGNSLNLRQPRCLQLVMDSLRYWVQQMHVDGFRFDLATTLARGESDFQRDGTFLSALLQDPVLSQVKLIVEPWDVGADGYHVGDFPAGVAEWNDRYRDTVRRFWRGDRGQLGDLAFRLSGSSDLFALSGRSACASINFVTSHDGFTLADLVSYERKHNEANGEENRDGSDNHLSCNWGVEGPAVDEPTLRLREQLVRSFWATLAFSLGIPMINAGDELGRTQRGNNNAYCQDNEISWLDWTLDDQRRELLAFVQDVLAIRRAHADLQRCAFFRGDLVPGSAVKDVTWLAPDGHEMSGHEWHDGRRQALGMLVHGHLDGGVDARGKALMTQTLLLLLNGGRRACRFQLPSLTAPGRWNLLVHSGVPQVEARRLHGASIRLVPHSLVLLRYEQENP